MEDRTRRLHGRTVTAADYRPLHLESRVILRCPMENDPMTILVNASTEVDRPVAVPVSDRRGRRQPHHGEIGSSPLRPPLFPTIGITNRRPKIDAASRRIAAAVGAGRPHRWESAGQRPVDPRPWTREKSEIRRLAAGAVPGSGVMEEGPGDSILVSIHCHSIGRASLSSRIGGAMLGVEHEDSVLEGARCTGIAPVRWTEEIMAMDREENRCWIRPLCGKILYFFSK